MRLVWRRRLAQEGDPELIWLVVSVAAIAGAVAWLALALPWPKCPFLAVTGFPCLTCGATRSAITLLHGNIVAAAGWNPLAFAVLCGLVVFDLYAAIVVIGRTPRLRIIDWSVTDKNVVRIAVIFLLALNWLYLLTHRARF
jgi:hypothetical protein